MATKQENETAQALKPVPDDLAGFLAQCEASGYVSHPHGSEFDGPDDAPVYFGLPEHNAVRDEASDIYGFPVVKVAVNGATGCAVYLRADVYDVKRGDLLQWLPAEGRYVGGAEKAQWEAANA